MNSSIQWGERTEKITEGYWVRKLISGPGPGRVCTMQISKSNSLKCDNRVTNLGSNILAHHKDFAIVEKLVQ